MANWKQHHRTFKAAGPDGRHVALDVGIMPLSRDESWRSVKSATHPG